MKQLTTSAWLAKTASSSVCRGLSVAFLQASDQKEPEDMMRLREGDGVRKCGELTRESPINRQCVMASPLWQRRAIVLKGAPRSSGRRRFNRLCPRHTQVFGPFSTTLSRKKSLGDLCVNIEKYSRIDTRKKVGKKGRHTTDTKTSVSGVVS